MRFLHRFLLENMTNETLSDPLCTSSCIDDLKYFGSCSYTCFKLCPSICKIVVDFDTSLSPPPVTSDKIKKISIFSAFSIVTALFLLSLLIVCFKWYNKRRSSIAPIPRRWNIDEARNSDFTGPVFIDHPIWHIRTIGLNPTVISSIKVCKYSKQDGVVEGTDCSVCLSEFQEEETLRLLPKCKHAFHLSCIDTWLRSHTNCPLCRAPIVVINTVNDDNDGEDLQEILVTIPEESGEVETDHVEDADVRDGAAEEELQQRVRRSVSLDSLRLSEIIAGKGKEKVKRSNTGSSIVGMSTFLKRSISYNGK